MKFLKQIALTLIVASSCSLFALTPERIQALRLEAFRQQATPQGIAIVERNIAALRAGGVAAPLVQAHLEKLRRQNQARQRSEAIRAAGEEDMARRAQERLQEEWLQEEQWLQEEERLQEEWLQRERAQAEQEQLNRARYAQERLEQERAQAEEERSRAEAARQLREEHSQRGNGESSAAGARRAQTAITIDQCDICLEDVDCENTTNLSCGHTYCNECLTRVVDLAMQEQSAEQFKCPNTGCAAQMTEQDIQNITHNNAEKVAAHGEIMMNAWLNKEAGVKHCPTPDCSYAFCNEEGHKESVRCPRCAETYCSECLQRHAAGAACGTAGAIESDDQETAAWKRAHTKQCPGCQAPIEKNEGCPHMRCRNCQAEFCWECLATDHVYGECLYRNNNNNNNIIANNNNNNNNIMVDNNNNNNNIMVDNNNNNNNNNIIANNNNNNNNVIANNNNNNNRNRNPINRGGTRRGGVWS